MTDTYALRDYGTASPAEIEDALERSEVVYFEHCPVELPSADDLHLLRDGLPAELGVDDLLHRREEGVDVDVEEDGRLHAPTIRSSGCFREDSLRRCAASTSAGSGYGATAIPTIGFT